MSGLDTAAVLWYNKENDDARTGGSRGTVVGVKDGYPMERLTAADFEAVYRLMEASFPVDERRTRAGQQALLEEPAYRLWGEWDGGELMGFAAVWELQPMTFVEHLAVEPRRRNGGTGSRMLAALAAEYGALCLEVELPHTEMAARRVGFYRRNGFQYNDYPYMQPALSPGSASIPLRIMTRERSLSPAEFAALREQLYARVYRCTEQR